MKQNHIQTRHNFTTEDGWEQLSNAWKTAANDPEMVLTITDHFVYLLLSGKDVFKAFRKMKRSTYYYLTYELSRSERKPMFSNMDRKRYEALRGYVLSLMFLLTEIN